MDYCIVCKNSTKFDFFDMSKEILICQICQCVFSKSNKIETFPNITKSGIYQNIKNRINHLTSLSYYEFLKKSNLKIQNCFDIGAGEGHFLKILEKDGIKTEGIEFNEKTWKLREVSSIKLGNFESYINKKNYDLISINQTIYYFDDPIQILKKIQKMLTPDGHIMIVTTNMNSKFRKENKIWTQGCKICLSESNFKNFSFIGLDLIKIQNFDDKIYRDYYLSKKSIIRKIIFFLKLFPRVYLFKNFICQNKDGINYFVLLKNNGIIKN